MHLADYVYHVLFRRHGSLKLPLSCKVVEKRCFGPPICRGRVYPEFGHAFSNRTFEHVAGFWLSSIQRARRVGGEKRKKDRR